jgi:DNA-binding GntR family transcriptional regulator
VVATPKFDDLRDTYRVRGLIEVEALRLAVKHVDAKLIAELERHFEAGSLALRTLDSASYRRASAAFHEALVAASRSNIYVGLGRQLIARTTFPLERRLMVERQKDHRDLLEALRERKWERAIAILKRHTERAPLVVKEIIRRATAEERPPRGGRGSVPRRPAKTKRVTAKKKKRAT